ncbi:hypothetical protein FRB95_000325 [Tulasnella sp. JGI-2019a]|nr:hypothetical protein FRB95_000325 [Tulasnella sp. JGI-2019a]
MSNFPRHSSLRAIVRSLLATGPTGTTSCFTSIARTRVQHSTPRKLPSPSSLFTTASPDSSFAVPTKALYDTLARARALFGVGLGFESLPILTSIINRILPLQWEIDSEMEDALIVLDADLAQAIQSCREQLASGSDLVKDMEGARTAVKALRDAMDNCQEVVESWGGEFPLEKGMMSIEGWKF